MRIILYILLSALPLSSQTHKLSGHLFGDYFYKVSGDSSSSISEYSSYKKDHNAFDIRRVMLIYENDISEKFKAGFSLEGGNRFLLNGRFGVIIKTAFLQWKNIFPRSDLFAGYFPTPAFVWGLSERLWNYRFVEKTISDFRNLTTPVDLGVSLRGSFDKNSEFGYSFMIGNGSGLRPEFNKFKKFYLSFNFNFTDMMYELYFDFEPDSDGRNIRTIKGIMGFSFFNGNLTIGTEFLGQGRIKYGTNGENISPAALNFYLYSNLLKNKATKKPLLKIFARADIYDPDLNTDSAGYSETFYTAGLDYMPMENVHIVPNIWINSYLKKSDSLPDRKSDVVVRMTFYYTYK
jgi:hypothetical protein